LAEVSKDEALEVMRVGELLVEGNRPLERRDGVSSTASAIPRERQLVLDAWRCVVELNRCRELLSGAVISALCVKQISEHFARTGCGGVELRGLPEVALRRGAIAPPLVGLAPPQIREHRGALERDGARVGFDGDERIVACERGISIRDELSEPPLLLDGDVTCDGDPRGAEHEEEGQ
jgi:hypothetical protein